MKKIIALILCLMLLCVPIVASAEDYEAGDVFEGEVTEDEATLEEESPVEEEIQPPVEAPPTEGELTLEEEVNIVTEQIVEWITANIEELGVIITLVGYGIVLFNKLKTIIRSAGTINNNAITIADKSNVAISKALADIETASSVVTSYDARIVALLEAFKTTAEDKQKLETELVEIKNYLQTATKSNLEFADELAELLGLANIPNYKKEEIGARHLAAKKDIIEAEAKAEAAALLPTSTEEVKKDVEAEA